MVQQIELPFSALDTFPADLFTPMGNKLRKVTGMMNLGQCIISLQQFFHNFRPGDNLNFKSSKAIFKIAQSDWASFAISPKILICIY